MDSQASRSSAITVDASGRAPNRQLGELVMAWACDIQTGEPRYILELGAHQAGAQCGCECPSCGLPLTAVNAAKERFTLRPHFRHPPGAQRDACLVLAARYAILEAIRGDEWIELPARRMSATAEGLSGHTYEAWVEFRREKLRISEVNFADRTRAVLTFDDGRQLVVVLNGSTQPSTGDQGEVIPTIVIECDDARVAAMPRDQLRQHLKLLPEALCWQSHWRDAELIEQAQTSARADALLHLDEVPAGCILPQGLGSNQRRESVLHYEAKQLLSEAQELWVPGATLSVSAASGSGTVQEHWSRPKRLMSIDHVELEQHMGAITPDVVCKAWPKDGGRVYWPLLIEVTVTNTIDSQRLERIRAAGEAALEIDLSVLGGRMTREELRRFLLEDTASKRWLHDPELEERRALITAQVNEQAGRAEARAKAQLAWRDAVLEMPMSEIAAQYLDAVERYLLSYAADEPRLTEREAVARAAEMFRLRGYPEAQDEHLFGWRGIISRILSIKANRGVGYSLPNAWGVINAIRQAQGVGRATHSLYLIAIRVYQPQMTSEQQAEIVRWSRLIKESVKRGEMTYKRHPVYDRVLSLLFPELAQSLSHPFAKRLDSEMPPAHAEPKEYRAFELHSPGIARFMERQPRGHQSSAPLLDTTPTDYWLQGRDLEAWRRANPEASTVWFGEGGSEG